jgi:hypothetical protein
VRSLPSAPGIRQSVALGISLAGPLRPAQRAQINFGEDGKQLATSLFRRPDNFLFTAAADQRLRARACCCAYRYEVGRRQGLSSPRSSEPSILPVASIATSRVTLEPTGRGGETKATNGTGLSRPKVGTSSGA